MDHPAPPRDPAVVRAEGRLLDAVASGLVLEGTLAELAQTLGVHAAPLRMALRELCSVGWVAARTHPANRLTVRLERRLAGQQRPSVPFERRRGSQDAWTL